MKVCLNMIVNNEAKIIRRCLNSVVSIISYYVIHDTQSTDDTPNIIQEYFKEKNIEGKLIKNVKFINFAHNRNLALQDTIKYSKDHDYILLLDADMVVSCGNLLEASLQKRIAALSIMQHYKDVKCSKIRLIHKSISNVVKYLGVTHEFLEIPNNCEHCRLKDEIILIHDIGDGCSETDKFERDQKLLENEVKIDPKNSRNWFYLAQTYRDLKKFDKSIITYTHYRKLSTFAEQSWFALYMIGKCQYLQNQSEQAISTLIYAFEIRPWRPEPVLLLTKILRLKSYYLTAWYFAHLAIKCRNPGRDVLFLERKAYTGGFLYELSILAYYRKEIKFGAAISNYLLIKNNLLSQQERNDVQNNFKFYLPRLQTHSVELNIPGIDTKVWSCINTSISCVKDNLNIAIECLSNENDGILKYRRFIKTDRTVEFKIEDNFMKYDSKVKGYSDFNIFKFNNEQWFSAVSLELNCKNTKMFVIGNIGQNKLFSIEGDEGDDKRKEINYLPFQHNNKLLIIYKYTPFTVYEIDIKTLSSSIFLEKQYENINMTDFVGITPPITDPVNGGYTFIIRQYWETEVHRFINLDSNLNIEKISIPFKLDRKAEVQHLSGFYITNNFACISWTDGNGHVYLSFINGNEIFKLSKHDTIKPNENNLKLIFNELSSI